MDDSPHESTASKDRAAYSRSLILQLSPSAVAAMAMRSSPSDPAPASCAAAVARPRLLDEMRARMRRLGLSLRTEEAYVGWVRRFILASGKRHPREMGAREVEAFLTVWATRGREAKRVRFI
jgi:hypothetical protein